MTPPPLTRDAILALPPGRELDALVEQHVFGRATAWYGIGHALIVAGSEKGPILSVPAYSENIEDAWEVFTHRLLTAQVVGYQPVPAEEDRELTDVDELGWARQWLCTCKGVPVYAPTAPLAICRAALLAVLQER